VSFGDAVVLNFLVLLPGTRLDNHGEEGISFLKGGACLFGMHIQASSDITVSKVACYTKQCLA
jgi:hypothetical protein